MSLQPMANQDDHSQSTESSPAALASAAASNKKDAFKDMLRQRQAALRTHRASAAPSDTRSRRSITAGYASFRDYYPSGYDYNDERAVLCISFYVLRQSRYRDMLYISRYLLKFSHPKGPTTTSAQSVNVNPAEQGTVQLITSRNSNGDTGSSVAGISVIFRQDLNGAESVTQGSPISAIALDSYDDTVTFVSQDRKVDHTGTRIAATSGLSTLTSIDVRPSSQDRGLTIRTPLSPSTKPPASQSAAADSRYDPKPHAPAGSPTSASPTGNIPVAIKSNNRKSVNAGSMSINTQSSPSSSRVSTPLSSPLTHPLPTKPAATMSPDTTGQNPTGISTQEERLKQKVLALMSARKEESTNESGSQKNNGGNNLIHDDAKRNRQSSPIILSTLRKAHLDSDNIDQQTSKRIKAGNDVNESVSGLSLNAIREERAAAASVSTTASISGIKQLAASAKEVTSSTLTQQPRVPKDPRVARRNEVEMDKERRQMQSEATTGATIEGQIADMTEVDMTDTTDTIELDMTDMSDTQIEEDTGMWIRNLIVMIVMNEEAPGLLTVDKIEQVIG
ncbi:hypothetical protein BGZ65_008224 [Modicella reniformis]|uniref:Uncharacterized protein n=1 Tax=Modicella reniformis TaxID=1440133 RepID=A0A9P6LU44_9FUNG|nr:hypothetical protein BGZ65_008224 [Modicella reniformis]